jgi:hypothetical protein
MFGKWFGSYFGQWFGGEQESPPETPVLGGGGDRGVVLFRTRDDALLRQIHDEDEIALLAIAAWLQMRVTT